MTSPSAPSPRIHLDFEKPVADLESRISELERASGEHADAVDINDEIRQLREKTRILLEEIYSDLSPWRRVQVARHQDRPRFRDYVARLCSEHVPLAGDRCFAEDPALSGGLARFRGRAVVVIGQEKGSDVQLRVAHNFGMARPEGYRKAARLLALADRFMLPVLVFVDTPGAWPGMDAEARGQAGAIARGIDACLDVRVPLIATIIGEGGSGGAIAIATANRVIMLEHAIYSVASPEACASILWRSSGAARQAADSLKLTSADCLAAGAVDVVVPEPAGGAHRAPDEVIDRTGDAISEALAGSERFSGEELREMRMRKYLDMGQPHPGTGQEW